MGINGLWDVLGKGETWQIADFAAAHFREHKRPLRIAVDEACWRYHSLSDEQVANIRNGEPAANPVEKTVLQKILRAYKLNIQLLFVWDGLRKPGKDRHRMKGRGGGKVDAETVKSLHNMFNALKVPYHQAPGEAEAECAKLQQLGIVDAVWADDGDALMFGCTTLIKEPKEKTKKGCMGEVRIYRVSPILEKLDMDTDSLVLFAVLSGGDYDLTGLPGCGPVRAKEMVKRRHGLSSALKHCAEADLRAWRRSLSQYLTNRRDPLEIPAQFPKWKALEGYRHPAVSTDEKCRSMSKLQRAGGWDQPINEQRLRCELRDRYNFTTREYLKHIAPLFLARALRNVTPQRKEENLNFGIQLKRTTTRKNAEGVPEPPKSTVNFWYDAARLVDIGLSRQPPEEDWTKFANKDGTPYDPQQRVDCEDFLLCLLEHGLPDGALEKPKTSPKKRRATETAEERNGSQPLPSTNHQSSSTAAMPARKRAKISKDQAPDLKPKRESKQSSAARGSPTLPRPQFKLHVPPPLAPPRSSNMVIDLGSDSDSEEGPADANSLFVSPDPTPKSSQTVPQSEPTLQSPGRAIPKFKPLRPNKYAPSQVEVQKHVQPSSSSTPKPKARKSLSTLKIPRVTHSDKVSTGLAQRSSSKDSATIAPHASDLGLKTRHSSASPARKKPVERPDLMPGEAIPAAKLRELRAAAHFSAAQSNVSPPSIPEPRQMAIPDNVIDLT